MAPRIVLSQTAEDYRGLVMRSVARYREWYYAEQTAEFFRRASRMGLSGRREDPLSPYMTVAYVVSAAEAFSLARITGLAHQELPGYPDLVWQLWERAVARVESTWENQAQAWKEWYGVGLAAAPEYRTLRPWIQARNAVMHGLGEMTRRQRKTATGLKELQQAGISVVGGTVLLGRSEVEGCAMSAVMFIEWLDRTAPGAA